MERVNLPLDIQAEVEESLKNSSYQFSLEDMKMYFGAAFSTLTSKLIVVELIVSLIAFVLGSYFGQVVPEIVRTIAIYVFSVTILGLVLATIYRANSRLIATIQKMGEKYAYFHLHEKRFIAQRESLTSDRKTVKQLFESNAVFFGLAFDENFSTTFIQPDGGADIDYNLKINATGKNITSISRYSHVTFEVFEGQDLPDMPTKNYVYQDDKLVALTPEVIAHDKRKVDWLLRATPRFPMNVPIPYEYRTELHPKAFCMNTEELDVFDIGFEWVSQNISYPTKRLSMKVVFPAGFKPKEASFDIWNTEHVKLTNQLEHDRVASNAGAWSMTVDEEEDVITLSLFVEYPIAGIVYAIKWVPPVVWPLEG